MKNIAQAIGSEIRSWIFFHSDYLDSSHENLCAHISQLCWTVLGTVDYRKTAEKIISQGMLDTVKHYQLACFYCLDEYISVLWEKLSEESKECFYNKALPDNQKPLEFYWPYILKGCESKLDNMGIPLFRDLTFYQYLFEYSVSKGNKAATEYFYQKLTNDEREVSLIRAIENELILRFNRAVLEDCTIPHSLPESKLSETFCYLFSLINCEQQIKILKENSCNVLLCLLDWPWQYFFLDMAKLLLPLLTSMDYVFLLERMAVRFQSDCCLKNLFQKFFLQAPCNFRKKFVDQQYRYGFFFRAFFNAQEEETIKIILKNIDYADRKRLVYSNQVFRLFINSLLEGERNLVELCIQEATLSKEDKMAVKQDFLRFLIREGYSSTENVWKEFLHIFNDRKPRAPKRKNSNEEHLSKNKELH